MDKLAEMMAEAAEVDLGTPFSLIQDAWDLVEVAAIYGSSDLPGNVVEIREMWLNALKTAVQAFHADQVNYRFNDKAV